MDGAAVWYGRVNEDGSFSVLARLVALDGAGTAWLEEEGKVIKQSDVASITAKVFALGTNRNNQAGTEVTPAPTLTPAANIYDALRTSGWPVHADAGGYNFRHDVAPEYVPDPRVWYLLEYKVTMTGGGVIWLKCKVRTEAVQT